jgi:predicted CopG family antitoxin
LTIRDEVYRKLINVKGKDESFSELFERLVETQYGSNSLKVIRGAIELTSEEKRAILASIDERRSERRRGSP